jgi:bacillithiol system protein YtxJ
LKKLETISDWETAKSNTEKPVLIAKLSPICPTSFSAEKIIENWHQGINENDIQLYTVNVIAAREVSNTIASQLGVTHQSPQVILLDKDGKAIADTSHYSIDQAWLDGCLEKS